MTSAHAQITPIDSRTDFETEYPGSIFETWDTGTTNTEIHNGDTFNGITYQYTNTVLPLGTPVTAFSTSPTRVLTLTTNDGLGIFLTLDDSITFQFQTPLTAFGIDFFTAAETNSGASGEDEVFQSLTDNGDTSLSKNNLFNSSILYHFLGFSSATPLSEVTITPNPDKGFNGLGWFMDTLRAVPAAPVSTTLLLPIVLLGMLTLRRKL